MSDLIAAIEEYLAHVPVLVAGRDLEPGDILCVGDDGLVVATTLQEIAAGVKPIGVAIRAILHGDPIVWRGEDANMTIQGPVVIKGPSPKSILSDI